MSPSRPFELTYAAVGSIVCPRIPGDEDGLKTFRVVFDQPERVRLFGEVYTIDQKLHVFGLDLEVGPGDVWRWTLYYEPTGSSDPVLPFRASQWRNLVLYLTDPGEAEWSSVQNGELLSGEG